MMRLLRLLLSWSVSRILLFVLVVAAMAALVKAVEAWNSLPALAAEVEALETNEAMLRAELERQRREAAAALAEVDRLERPMLRERLASVRRQIAEIESGRASGVELALQAARGEGSALAREAGKGFRLELLRREAALIVARFEALERRGRMQGLDARIAALDARVAAVEQRIAAIERAEPLLSRLERVPIVRELQGPWRELRAARRQLAAAQGERQRLATARQGVNAAFVRARDVYRGAYSALRDAPAPADALRGAIGEKRGQLEGHWASRVWAAVKPVIGWALWITLLVILVPPAVKAFWFFVVAPVAARLRPLRVDPSDAGEAHWAEARRDGGAAGSSVTWRLRLQPGEEALLRPEYLQSSPGGATSGSQLLLSRSLPFGSLAAGLYGLTRISAAGREAMIAVSATRDPVDEVGIVEVPEGSSLVFRPHYLIGVVRRADRPLVIDRIWTLNRLTSWLTLRLRHIVFRGPCALIVKGARGIALEPAAGGRRVAGAATMGWSAGLEHRVDRSEAFLAFLVGKQSLFVDRFEGPRGTVVYEELPRGGGRSGLFGRGLEGVGEAMLKVVGL
jgi:hypothetical protein